MERPLNSDKMPPQKVKIKKQKMGISKIRIQFFNFNFFGGACCHLDKFAFVKSA
jgi:hypothetical protein